VRLAGVYPLNHSYTLMPSGSLVPSSLFGEVVIWLAKYHTCVFACFSFLSASYLTPAQAAEASTQPMRKIAKTERSEPEAQLPLRQVFKQFFRVSFAPLSSSFCDRVLSFAGISHGDHECSCRTELIRRCLCSEARSLAQPPGGVLWELFKTLLQAFK
jgi:hypothetical protein